MALMNELLPEPVTPRNMIILSSWDTRFDDDDLICWTSSSWAKLNRSANRDMMPWPGFQEAAMSHKFTTLQSTEFKGGEEGSVILQTQSRAA
jgi:hypothetical protein